MNEVLDIKKIRSGIPGVQNKIHFNNAGASFVDQIVNDEIIAYLQKESLEGGYKFHRDSVDIIDRIYGGISKMIHCKPSEISILGSASAAFNKALYSIPFQNGDIILCSDLEYGNNYLNYLNLKKLKGIEIQVFDSYDKGEGWNSSNLTSHITDKVKLISVTHMPTSSGTIAEIEKIGSIAQQYDILYLVDACQSVGQKPLDVNQIKCDFLSGTSRKYMRGPRGLGFLYAKEEAVSKLDLNVLDSVGAMWENEHTFSMNKEQNVFETFEKPYALIAGYAKAVEVYNSYDQNDIWNRTQRLAANLRNELRENSKITVKDVGISLSGIVSFKVREYSDEKIQNSLEKLNINTSVTSIWSSYFDLSSKGINTAIRASLHYYNTEGEIEQFMSKLNDLI